MNKTKLLLNRIITSALMILIISSCAHYQTDTATNLEKAQASQFALAMPDKYSAEAVYQVLAEGGNAVDASVTAAFVLAVTFPEAGNIGGGGFMLSQMNGELHFLDYREKAPAAATRDMYQNEDGSVNSDQSVISARASGVPGTVKGLWAAHQKFGTKQWAELIAPAIELAKNGFQVNPKKTEEVASKVKRYGDKVNFVKYFGAMQKPVLFKQPELAATLSRIAEQGPADFYQGKTAELIVAQMQRDGGLITLQDLQNYQTVWRKPLVYPWKEYSVVSAPPPSSGGFAVINLLRMKESLKDKFAGLEHNSPQYVHLIAEMEKRIFADRAEYFGDPDFVDVPMQKLMAEDYIQARANEVQLDKISQLDSVKPGLESPNTTHFSIIDRWGNAVSNTYTLNLSYGNGMVVEGAGFLMNNEMDDFSIKPGVKNAYGVVGGTANEIQPNKRMLSSMSPTLLLKDGAVEMVVGTPGGSTIFTSVFQSIVNAIEFEMSAQQAVSVSRFHHQLIPAELITMSIAYPLPDNTQSVLKERGYRVEPHGWEFGDLQMIVKKQGKLTAGSDARGIGVSKVGTVKP